MPASPLATLLKQLMDERRMSQRALSRRSAVPQSAISEILSGKRTKPRKATLDRLAVTFGIPPETLLASGEFAAPGHTVATALLEYLDDIAWEVGEAFEEHTSRTASVLPCDTAGRSAPLSPAAATGPSPAAGTTVDAIQFVLGPESPRGVVVHGGAGIGKTSLLLHVAASEARKLRGERLGDDLGAVRTPIFVRLREFQDRMDDLTRTREGTDERSLIAYLTIRHGDSAAAVLVKALAEGRAILLLDGYDDIEDEQTRERIRRILGAALRRWPEARIVITSRTARCVELLGLRELAWAKLEELSLPQARELLSRRASAAKAPQYSSLDQLLSPDARLALEASGMAGDPLVLCHLFDLVTARRQPLHHLGDLAAEILRGHLAKRSVPRSRATAEREITQERLETLALAMACEGADEGGVEFGWAIGILAEGDDAADRSIRRAARSFLDRELDRAEILVHRPGGRLAFRYEHFRDHLAARALADLADAEDGGWWSAIRGHLGEPTWQGVIDHLAFTLQRTGLSRADRLLDRLLTVASTAETADAARLEETATRLARILERAP